MTVDLDALLKLVRELGVFVVAAGALYWAVFLPRKDKKGNPRSSLIVPGWKHDQDIAECHEETSRVRRFYETAINDRDKQTELRVGEVRGYRDEAVAVNAELLRTLSSATRDIALVLQILDMASRDGSQPGAESETATGG
jgi:hypothetical protein